MNKKKFVMLIIGGLLVGALSGWILENIALSDFGEVIKSFLIKNVFKIVLIVIIMSILIAFALYKKSKVEIEKGLQGEDPIQTKYTNYSLMVREVSTFLIFGLASMWAMAMEKSWLNLGESVVLIGLLIAYIILTSVIFQKNYELIKKVEPNRKADTLDFKFNKKFIEESDEMTKARYYKKGYIGYRAIIFTNFIMLVVLAGLANHLDVGIIAPIFIAISSIIGIIAAK
ncbi:MAG: DUF3169 family protein [Anaerococcus sp.]|uniref:DUF3169 family protein n=1 Tax=Anaerococcus sp. TaxID=1872515 RepID=UPI002633D28A|nr:DUF3169 family protein [Anaerococcus sp.]MCI5972858.1 DUF3169 family protein [Anaerococcus sp.]MDY2928528.1 DUF3169 family protein [Anaerococcus sp.]